jgi:hypothetical protein
MRRGTMSKVLLILATITFAFNPVLAGAAPVTLPSGKVIELSQGQVATIKSQPGVFFSTGAPETLTNQAVVGLPKELGGGFLYGTPEALAQAFTTAGAAVGPPAEAFATAGGLSTAAKVGIAVGAAAVIGVGAAALAGGGGGGGGGGTTTTSHH